MKLTNKARSQQKTSETSEEKALRALRKGMVWRCPNCGALLEKKCPPEAMLAFESLLGTNTCGNCRHSFDANDVYGGKFDVSVEDVLTSTESHPTTPISSQLEPTESGSEQSKQELWTASPHSRCGVCGKELRGLSGGTVLMRGGALETILEGARYVCPTCGFVSCFECSWDATASKITCKRCNTRMQRG